jgi:hypothetical protein
MSSLNRIRVVLRPGLGAELSQEEPLGWLGRIELGRTLLATAVAQALVAVIAVIAGMGYPASPPMEILGVMPCSPRCGSCRPGCSGKRPMSKLPRALRRRLSRDVRFPFD